MLRRLFGSRQLLAVAIMPRAICYLQLKKIFHGLKVAAMSVEPLTRPVHSGAKITDFVALEECLRVGLAQYARSPIATCISAAEVQIKTLLVPAVFSADEVEAEVCAQLLRGMPVRQERLQIDFHQGDLGVEDEVKTDIVAAKADYIAQLKTCFAEHVNDLQIIDIDAFALIRAAKFLAGNIVRPAAMIYIDHRYAVCAGWERRKLLFHRVLDTDAADFDGWLQQLLQMNQHINCEKVMLFMLPEDVESIKKTVRKYWSCSIVAAEFSIAGKEHQELFANYPEAYVALGLALRGVSDGL